MYMSCVSACVNASRPPAPSHCSRHIQQSRDSSGRERAGFCRRGCAFWHAAGGLQVRVGPFTLLGVKSAQGVFLNPAQSWQLVPGTQ